MGCLPLRASPADRIPETLASLDALSFHGSKQRTAQATGSVISSNYKQLLLFFYFLNPTPAFSCLFMHFMPYRLLIHSFVWQLW